MDLTIIDSILSSNTPEGSNVYGGNVRSGDFTLPGANGTTPGVGVGNPISSQIFMTFSDAADISTYTGNEITVGANAITYFPIKNYKTASTEDGIPFGAPLVDVDGKTYIRFRSACALFINPDSGSSFNELSVKISYKDYYGNLGTMDIDNFSSSNSWFVFPRCVFELYSIKFTSTSSNSNTFYIGVYPKFELPYYDLGNQTNLMALSYSFPYSTSTIESGEDEILIFNGLVAETAGFATTPGYNYTPGNLLNNPLTKDSGTVRPIIDFSQMGPDIANAYPEIITLNLLEGSSASVIQNVYGIGNTLPNYFSSTIPLDSPTDPSLSTYLNFAETIIGQEQFSENWTDRSS